MVVKISSFKADLALEESGAWVDWPDAPGVAFKVSSLHLPAYQTARDLMVKRLQVQFVKDAVPRQIFQRELGRLYAQHILHDWRGLDVDYSPETAMTLLIDPEYRPLVAGIEWCASRVGEIEIQFVDDEAKNSDAPSVTG